MIRTFAFVGLSALGLLASAGLCACHDARSATGSEQAPGQDTALTVSLVSPVTRPWSERLMATGNIEAWQMMSVGAEVSGSRVVEVLADVGSVVHKGQLLARLDDAPLHVDLSMQRAALEQARADLAQAQVSLGRARRLGSAISQQDLSQAQTNAKTSTARFDMAQAQIRALELKIRDTRIVAPDDGVVAARNASVGALIDGSTELFKLIRQGRIEWRAQIRPEDLGHVEIGQVVRVRDPLGSIVTGRVRQIAPTADEVSRMSLVYVDVPPSRSLAPGMLATGEFQLLQRMALTVPHDSLMLRDGFNYAMTVGRGGSVRPIKVQIGEQRGNDVEILAGLSPGDRIIARGVAFLHAGDRVKVVSAVPERTAMSSTAR